MGGAGLYDRAAVGGFLQQARLSCALVGRVHGPGGRRPVRDATICKGITKMFAIFALVAAFAFAHAVVFGYCLCANAWERFTGPSERRYYGF